MSKELRMKAFCVGTAVVIFALMGIFIGSYQKRESERKLQERIIEEYPIEESKMEEYRKGKEERTRMVEVKEETVPEVAAEFTPHEEIPLDADYQEHIESECERLGVNPAYMYALIESESDFIPGQLVSDGGGYSFGLCQINSVNWPRMEAMELDPSDEYDCITFAITLISEYLKKYDGSTNLMDVVTTCYKAGEAGAEKCCFHLSVCEEIEERTNYYNEILRGE